MFAPVLVVGRALMAAPRLLLPADRLDVMEAVRAPRAGSANRLLRAPQVRRSCLGA